MVNFTPDHGLFTPVGVVCVRACFPSQGNASMLQRIAFPAVLAFLGGVEMDEAMMLQTSAGGSSGDGGGKAQLRNIED